MPTVTRLPSTGRATKPFNAAASILSGPSLSTWVAAPAPKAPKARSAGKSETRRPTVDIAFGQSFIAEFKRQQTNHTVPASFHLCKRSNGRILYRCAGGDCSCPPTRNGIPTHCAHGVCFLHSHATAPQAATGAGLRDAATEAALFVTELFQVCNHSGLANIKHSPNGLRSSCGVR